MSEVGRLIADRYRLTEHIGSGAMGMVWQAHDERLHRTVALKRLLVQPGLSASEAHEARERAMREGRIAARLQHPNAVTVYDVVEDDGEPVLIMEYVPSRSLSAVLDQRGPLPPQEVARIGAQVATALTAAHAAGIVHRDIKPGNVLLTEDGVVKITDFGISRATGDVTVTATGMLAGTPAYLAPEVAKGENPGPPSDVFSLASTVYAAVEGQPPFGLGDNTLAILHAVAACRTNPPRQAGPLTALLMQMLRANPQERPTMSEVTKALSAVAAGQLANLAPATGATAVVPDPATDPTVRTWTPQPSPPYGLPTQAMPPGTPAHGMPPLGTPAHGMAAPMPPMPQMAPRPMPPQAPPPRPQRRPAPAANGRAPMAPWLRRVLTAAAIIGAALIGILVANVFVTTGGNHAAAGQSTVTQTTPTVPFTQSESPVAATTESTTQTTTPTSTTPTSSTQPPKPTYQDMMAVLQQYFSLLPRNPQAAWTLLSPAYQAKSGGFGNFQKSWATVLATQLDGSMPHGDNTVLAKVRILTTDGQFTDDPYSFQFTVQNGRLLINDGSLVGKPGKHG